MTSLRVFPGVALAAGLLLAVGGTAAQPQRLKLVQPPPKVVQVPPKNAGAVELPVIPKSVGAFLTIKVSDLVDHPDLKPVLVQLKKTPEALDGVTEMLGVQPQEMERVTLFWPVVSPRGPGEPVLVITTREAFNEARVLKALRAEPVFDGDRGGFGGGGFGGGASQKAEPKTAGNAIPATDPNPIPFPPQKEPAKKPAQDPTKRPEADADDTFPISTTIPADPLFYSLRGGPFELLFLVDDRTLVFLPGGPSSEFTTMALLSQFVQKKQTGPLADAIASAGNHTLAAGISLPSLFRDIDRQMPPHLAPYAALTAARTGTLTGDLDKTAKLTVKLTFDDAAAARRAAPVLEEGLKSLAEKATAEAVAMKERRTSEKALAALVEAAAAALKKASVKADGTAVIATTDLDVGPAAATAVGDLLQSITSRKKFDTRANNMKQIGLALHNYFDANQSLPANVYGPNGEPLLSWRVHLLPYMEQDNLYRQFNMKEAWDGPTNKKLIEQMPKVFEVAGREAPKGQTFYQAFLTPDPRKAQPKNGFFARSWLVEGDTRGQTLLVPDGTSNTIAVVEARTGVTWSKPDDIPFTEKLPPLGEDKADRFMALFLDGSVRAIPTNLKPDMLRLLIDGQDGMPIPEIFDEDRPRGFPFGAGRARAEAELLRDVAVAREVEQQRARADFEAASAELEQTRAAAELAAAELARVTELFKKGAAAAAEVTAAQAKLDAARAIVERNAARVESLKRVPEKK